MSREKKVFLLSAFLCNWPYTFVVGLGSDRIVSGTFVWYRPWQWAVQFFIGLGITVFVPLSDWARRIRRGIFPRTAGTKAETPLEFFFSNFIYQSFFSLLSFPFFHFITPSEERSLHGSLSTLIPYFLVGLVLNMAVGICFIRICDRIAEKVIPE